MGLLWAALIILKILGFVAAPWWLLIIWPVIVWVVVMILIVCVASFVDKL